MRDRDAIKEQPRPLIGISSCLLGSLTRYDGGHALDEAVIDALGPRVRWLPVCPEVECGMPVPREPMRLVRATGGPRLVTVYTSIDRTDDMRRFIERRIGELGAEGLAGIILKGKSPSCAVSSAPVFGPDGDVIDTGPGLFASALMEAFPSLPVEEACMFLDAGARDAFIKLMART